MLDHGTIARLIASGVITAAGIVAAVIAGRLLGRRANDVYARYYARKLSRYLAGAVVLIGLAIVWRAFAGRVAVVLGFAAAGLAFAMQESIGAVAGWFNIVSGRIFRVGDRIEMGGVRGDVIDITPLRTKVMEIGSTTDDHTWVRGRQYTGRIVAISNKATFTTPVFNYSAVFDFIWEELTVSVGFDADWHTAEKILEEEVRRISASEGARETVREMARRYPVPRAEVEPSVYVRATDNYLELAARFVVPVRTARTAKDQLTRRVLERLAEADIEVAYPTSDVRVMTGGTQG